VLIEKMNTAYIRKNAMISYKYKPSISSFDFSKDASISANKLPSPLKMRVFSAKSVSPSEQMRV
jgi:hypothetical protein